MAKLSFDLLYDFERFRRNHYGKKIGVFLHTSIILDSLNHLKNFIDRNESNVSVFLPDNCVYELKLLSKYSSFPINRDKAKFVLNSNMKNCTWTFVDMINFKRSILEKHDIDIALFVFFDPPTASYFSSRMGFLQNVFLLNYDPYDSTRVFNTPISIGSPIVRFCKPLNTSKLSEPFTKKDKLLVCDKNRKVIKELYMSEMQPFNCGGGEAKLFTHPSMPSKVFKVFAFNIGDVMTEKLKHLIPYSTVFQSCVFPTELVYREDKCIGYVMDKIDGKTLDCVLFSFSNEDRINLIRKLSVIILELRLAQIAVTDLSSGNIFILENGIIRLIDCDSMEFYYFPGGGVTPPYGHPDVTEDYFYKKLRTTDQVNFSFAVMIFEILMGWKNPLIQKGVGDDDPVWKKNKFPFDNYKGIGVVASGVKVNDEFLKVWRDCPLAIREGFVDVFTFKTSYDIGEWIKRMNFI